MRTKRGYIYFSKREIAHANNTLYEPCDQYRSGDTAHSLHPATSALIYGTSVRQSWLVEQTYDRLDRSVSFRQLLTVVVSNNVPAWIYYTVA